MAKRRKNDSYKVILLAVVIAVVLFALFRTCSHTEQNKAIQQNSDFVVYMLDVGQGDCFFIDNGDKDILVDGGPIEVSETIVNQLQKLGVSDIEYMFVSHSDADHIGGADDIIEGFNVKNVVVSEDTRTTKTYKQFMSSMEEKSIQPYYANQGDEFTVGEAEVKILSPSSGEYSDSNEKSLVLMIYHANFKYLFTGDADETVEADLLCEYSSEELDCDLLKVGHHGSHSSSSESFLATVTPKISLISVGDDNAYGHPHSTTITNLQKYSDKICRTDREGTVAVYEKDGALYTENID